MDEFLGFIFTALLIYGVYVFFKNKKDKKGSTSNQETEAPTKITYPDILKEKGFVISKAETISTWTIYVDDEHKKWSMRRGTPSIKLKADEVPVIYNFSDLIDFEVFEDGNSIASGRAGSALVGGLLFGAAGAVVGGSRKKKVKNICTGLEIRIRVNNLQEPEKVITLIHPGSKVKKDSLVYKNDIQAVRKAIPILTYIRNGSMSQ